MNVSPAAASNRVAPITRAITSAAAGGTALPSVRATPDRSSRLAEHLLGLNQALQRGQFQRGEGAMPGAVETFDHAGQTLIGFWYSWIRDSPTSDWNAFILWA